MVSLVGVRANSNTTDCSISFADQMGSGGGILMFFLGFIVGALVIGLIWLLMDQRWKSWSIFGGQNRVSPSGNPSGPYASLPTYPPPGAYPGPQPAYSSGSAYAPQQIYTWPAASYQTQYEVVPQSY